MCSCRSPSPAPLLLLTALPPERARRRSVCTRWPCPSSLGTHPKVRPSPSPPSRSPSSTHACPSPVSRALLYERTRRITDRWVFKMCSFCARPVHRRAPYRHVLDCLCMTPPFSPRLSPQTQCRRCRDHLVGSGPCLACWQPLQTWSASWPLQRRPWRWTRCAQQAVAMGGGHRSSTRVQ